MHQSPTAPHLWEWQGDGLDNEHGSDLLKAPSSTGLELLHKYAETNLSF